MNIRKKMGRKNLMRSNVINKFMVGFSCKEISNPLSLGEQLKECRHQREMGLSEVARTIGVSTQYLQALENGNYNQLPGDIYAKNFLKVYAKFLGLEQSKILTIFQSEKKIYSKTNKNKTNDFSKPVEKISKAHLIVTPRIVKSTLIILLAIACLVYLGFKIRIILTPPLLTISQPLDNLVTEQNFIEIVGQTEVETLLEINGQQVLADEVGNFREVIDLQSGVNIIEIKAKTRHGKETKQYLQVVMVDTEGEDN